MDWKTVRVHADTERTGGAVALPRCPASGEAKVIYTASAKFQGFDGIAFGLPAGWYRWAG